MAGLADAVLSVETAASKGQFSEGPPSSWQGLWRTWPSVHCCQIGPNNGSFLNMPLSVLICIKVYCFHFLQWHYLYHNDQTPYYHSNSCLFHLPQDDKKLTWVILKTCMKQPVGGRGSQDCTEPWRHRITRNSPRCCQPTGREVVRCTPLAIPVLGQLPPAVSVHQT